MQKSGPSCIATLVTGLTGKNNLENDSEIFIKLENEPILPAINSASSESKLTLASGVEIWCYPFQYSMCYLLIIIFLVSSHLWDLTTFVVDISSCFLTWPPIKHCCLVLFHFPHINKSFLANCTEPLKISLCTTKYKTSAFIIQFWFSIAFILKL